MKDIRMPAEWESCECVLLALPAEYTDWNYILPEAQEQYRRLVKALTDAGIHCVVLTPSDKYGEEVLEGCGLEKVTLLPFEYNDTWTRDYGPISVVRGERQRALDFGFNGWGLKFASDKDNLVNLKLCERYVILPQTYRNERTARLPALRSITSQASKCPTPASAPASMLLKQVPSKPK